MLQQACERLIAEAEKRRNDAIAAAEAEYQRALAAVALIRSLSRPGRERLSHGRLSTLVQTAVGELDGTFTVRDVEARLQSLAPDVAERVSIASISTTLRRMVGSRLHVAEPGDASRASKYKKVELGGEA